MPDGERGTSVFVNESVVCESINCTGNMNGC